MRDARVSFRTRVAGVLVALLGLLPACGAAAPSSPYEAEYPAAAPAPAQAPTDTGMAAVAAAEEAGLAPPAPSPAALPATEKLAGAAAGLLGRLAPGAPAAAGLASAAADAAGAASAATKAAGAAAAASAPAAKTPVSAAPLAAKVASPDEPKGPEPAIAQLIIYTAGLRLQIERARFAESIDRVVEIAVSLGGFVASYGDEAVRIRVPSATFREALKKIEVLGTVLQRSVEAQDISEEFHDLQVRLKSLHATRDRLEQFLGRAKDMSEVLAIERELDRLNGEIDKVEGRMRFLASRAAYSTIDVKLEPKPELKVVAGGGESLPPPPPRTIPLPIDWLHRVGLGRLLDLD